MGRRVLYLLLALAVVQGCSVSNSPGNPNSQGVSALVRTVFEAVAKADPVTYGEFDPHLVKALDVAFTACVDVIKRVDDVIVHDRLKQEGFSAKPTHARKFIYKTSKETAPRNSEFEVDVQVWVNPVSFLDSRRGCYVTSYFGYRDRDAMHQRMRLIFKDAGYETKIKGPTEYEFSEIWTSIEASIELRSGDGERRSVEASIRAN